MKIYIPTRSRAHKICKGTLAWIPKNIEVNLVVYEDQFEDYEKATEHLPNITILVCPVKGISAKRKWIGKHAEYCEEETFLTLDDDLRFSTRDSNFKLKPSTESEMTSLLELVKLLLRDYSAVGVSNRQGNNNTKEDYAENTRLCRVTGFQTAQFNACEIGRIQFMEDFDILLQLLRKKLPILNIYSYAQDQNATQDLGGCSDYRTLQNHADSANLLAELHKPYVKLRQKNNKTGGEFGQRTEVTVYWKKAFKGQ